MSKKNSVFGEAFGELVPKKKETTPTEPKPKKTSPASTPAPTEEEIQTRIEAATTIVRIEGEKKAEQAKKEAEAKAQKAIEEAKKAAEAKSKAEIEAARKTFEATPEYQEFLKQKKAAATATTTNEDRPAMEAVLKSLASFAKKDPQFAAKFFKAAQPFAPKTYGAYLNIGGQLISVKEFGSIPSALTPEVYETQNGQPTGNPLKKEDAEKLLPTLL